MKVSSLVTVSSIQQPCLACLQASLKQGVRLPVTSQVFDVLNFDMIAMLRLPFIPSCASWIFKASNAPLGCSAGTWTGQEGHCHYIA